MAMVRRFDTPALPLSVPLAGVKAHTSVEVAGIVYQGQQGGFTIEYNKPTGTPFHVSVRMGIFGEKCVAFNHLRRGKWSTEEHHHNPLTFGKPFVLKISNEHNKCVVRIDGKQIGHYHLHSRTHKVHEFTLRGDVSLSYVQFNTNAKSKALTVVETTTPQPVILQQQPAVITMPTQQPIYVQQVVPSSNVYPQIYAYNQQPEVIVMDGYHHHHHHHHC